jgi:hypothetical protein
LRSPRQGKRADVATPSKLSYRRPERELWPLRFASLPKVGGKSFQHY